MLRSDDRFDDRSEIVDIRKRLNAKQYVIEGAFLCVRGLFWGSDHWGKTVSIVSSRISNGYEAHLTEV